MAASNTQIDPRQVKWDDGQIDPAKVQWDSSQSTQATSSATQEDPDVNQFIKQQGRAPTRDELASIRAGHQGNMFGALMNSFVGAPLRGAVAGWRGISDLVGGKGGAQAASDVAETSATDEATSLGGSATNAALKSPYNPLNYIDEAGEWLGNKSADAGWSPLASTALRIAPDAASAVLGFGKGNMEHGPITVGEPEAVTGTPNRFSGAVAAERARLQDIHDRGIAAGLDLPESGTQGRYAAASATNTPASNSIIRRHFGLPDDPETQAPLTPEMMEGVRAQVAAQTYGPVRAEPSISLSAKATDAIDALPPVIRNKLKLQGRPLNDVTPEQVSGGDFVDMSRRLRDVATSFDKAYNRGGHPEAGALADLAHDAVDAWEESGRDTLRATGREDIADRWEQGRTIIAQTHDVEAALDGAGNVNIAALRRRPYLTGDLDMLANLGGRYPDAFRTTRISQPQVSLPRRAAAAAVKPLATASGALLGSPFGAAGVAGGAAVGRLAGEGMAGKIAPQ